MFKKLLKGCAVLLGIFVALLAGFAVVVAMQPAEWTVARSKVIAASQPVVFAQVNDFHKWEAWSPWLKLDPDATVTYAGKDSGAGAQFSWQGNAAVGAGNMTITESIPPNLIRLELAFIEPFPDTAQVEFTFMPQGAGTMVTWSMSGHNNFLEKAICLFVNMDEMIGGDFDKGLENLNAAAEAANKP